MKKALKILLLSILALFLLYFSFRSLISESNKLALVFLILFIIVCIGICVVKDGGKPQKTPHKTKVKNAGPHKTSTQIQSRNIRPMTSKEEPDFILKCAEYLVKSGKFTGVLSSPPGGVHEQDLVAFDKDGNRWTFSCKDHKLKVLSAPKKVKNAAKVSRKTKADMKRQAQRRSLEEDIELFEMLSD